MVQTTRQIDYTTSFLKESVRDINDGFAVNFQQGAVIGDKCERVVARIFNHYVACPFDAKRRW